MSRKGERTSDRKQFSNRLLGRAWAAIWRALAGKNRARGGRRLPSEGLISGRRAVFNNIGDCAVQDAAEIVQSGCAEGKVFSKASDG